MQVQMQAVDGLANTRCGVAGLSSSLVQGPDMLNKGLQLLLVVLRLSKVACQAASTSFPQVGCRMLSYQSCLVKQ